MCRPSARHAMPCWQKKVTKATRRRWPPERCQDATRPGHFLWGAMLGWSLDDGNHRNISEHIHIKIMIIGWYFKIMENYTQKKELHKEELYKGSQNMIGNSHSEGILRWSSIRHMLDARQQPSLPWSWWSVRSPSIWHPHAATRCRCFEGPPTSNLCPGSWWSWCPRERPSQWDHCRWLVAARGILKAPQNHETLPQYFLQFIKMLPPRTGLNGLEDL